MSNYKTPLSQSESESDLFTKYVLTSRELGSGYFFALSVHDKKQY